MARYNYTQDMEELVRKLENTMREVGIIGQGDYLYLRLGNSTNGYPNRVILRDSIYGGESPLIEHAITVKRSEFRKSVCYYLEAIKSTAKALGH